MLAVYICPVVDEGGTGPQLGKSPQALPHNEKLALAVVHWDRTHRDPVAQQWSADLHPSALLSDKGGRWQWGSWAGLHASYSHKLAWECSTQGGQDSDSVVSLAQPATQGWC